ncbi:plastocyanin/azurin family copper-binding protein [Streptomyces sp. NPDC021096]|uniref:cupredoxin domain-containing protein n=1 Tax=Streptomyces sp. NPDC021096 TaxID=3154792 RepID=UPI00340F3435
MPRSPFRIVARTLAALAALLSMGVLAASPAVAAPPAAQTTVVIEGSPAVFVPPTVTIHPGDSVRWINNANGTHTTTSDTGVWDARLNPGQSFTRTFPTAGVFRYHCTIHPGMTGSVTVQ